MAAGSGLLANLAHDVRLVVAAAFSPLFFGRLAGWHLVLFYGVVISATVVGGYFIDEELTRREQGAQRQSASLVETLEKKRRKAAELPARLALLERREGELAAAGRTVGRVRSFENPLVALAALAGYLTEPGGVAFAAAEPEQDDFFVRLPVTLELDARPSALFADAERLTRTCRFCVLRVDRMAHDASGAAAFTVTVELFLAYPPADSGVEAWGEAVRAGHLRGADLASLRP